LRLARALVPLCRRAGVPLALNDRVDLAALSGADLADVGQTDLPLADARAVLARLGRPLPVGVSTHNLAQAMAAAAAGADYIGFGPVFATGSKTAPDPVVGLAALQAVCQAVSVPVVAIGGITRSRIAAVVEAGAAAAAVIGDIDTSSDRTAAGLSIGAAFGRSQHV
jgi:thiamine-phosphate pyrophosphorylase